LSTHYISLISSNIPHSLNQFDKVLTSSIVYLSSLSSSSLNYFFDNFIFHEIQDDEEIISKNIDILKKTTISTNNFVPHSSSISSDFLSELFSIF
jgi:hypothetical protein